MRLSETMVGRLSRKLMEDGPRAWEFAMDWTLLHAMCFDSVENDVRQLINYLDWEITKVVSSLFCRFRL